MINFYLYYNGELDNQHYAPCIAQVIKYNFTGDVKPIEHIIKKSPCYAYNYAKAVIKGRWKEAEPYIMEDSYWAFMYSYKIIKERWPEAEHNMKDDLGVWSAYCRNFKI